MYSSEQEDDIFDYQIGHSHHTGRVHYAREEGIELIHKYKKASSQWHQFLVNGLSGQPSRTFSTTNNNATYDIHAEVANSIVQVHQHNIYFNNTPGLTMPQLLDDALETTGSLQSVLSLRFLRELGMDQFRSLEQAAAMNVVLFTQSSLLCILPTGSGKSALFFACCLKNQRSTTVVVVPTISLQADLQSRAAAFCITSCIKPEDFNNECLIILTTDSSISHGARILLSQLAQRKALAKIFLDEAHAYVSDADYRPKMRDLCSLRLYDCALILLTGTAPKYIEDELLANFFPTSRPQVIRAPTLRNNIRYEVKAWTGTLCDDINATIGALRDEQRAIIYFSSVQDLRSFKDRIFSSTTYYSRLEETEKQRSAQLWFRGQFKCMLATSSFGVGVDFPSVAFVGLVGLPHSFEDYVQQTGRAGRDGSTAQTILFVDHRQHEATSLSGRIMRQYSESTRGCRRSMISKYMDGIAIDCYMSHSVQCDLCQTIDRNPFSTSPVVFSDPLRPLAAPPITSSTQNINVKNVAENADRQVILERKTSSLVLLNELLELSSRYKDCCGVCFAWSGKVAKHSLSKCPFMRGRCLKCKDTHGSDQCPYAGRRRNVRNGCYKCLLPGNQQDHRDTCIGDFAKDMLMSLYRLRKLTSALNNLPFTEFLNYMESSHESGVTNCAHLFCQFITSKSR